MGIGELKHRIIIQRPVITINENGFEDELYEDYKIVWAKVENLKGKEYFEASVVQKEKTTKFIIRSIKDIDETMKISFQGKIYDISFIDNINYENRYMEIKAVEVGRGG